MEETDIKKIQKKIQEKYSMQEKDAIILSNFGNTPKTFDNIIKIYAEVYEKVPAYLTLIIKIRVWKGLGFIKKIKKDLYILNEEYRV